MRSCSFCRPAPPGLKRLEFEIWDLGIVKYELCDGVATNSNEWCLRSARACNDSGSPAREEKGYEMKVK